MTNIPHWPEIPLWRTPRKTDLNLSLELLNALGNPQNKLPPTIHVAGTNGKGSSVALLKSIFMQAGYKVHSYTSPHLLEFNERIRLNDEPITDSHLYTTLERVKAAANTLNLKPNFFEGITVAAFLAFSESEADILLLETGLGGRLDCTNVITNPILTLITPISYDHMEHLGEDLLHIAFEKAGIIKKNTPCVIGPQADDVYNLLFNKCDEMEAPSFCYEYDFYTEKSDEGFHYQSQKFNLDLPRPALLGDHQIQNASSVIAAIMLLNDKFKITNTQIAAGLMNANWPGRLQPVEKEKVQKIMASNNSREDSNHSQDSHPELDSKSSSNNHNTQIYLDGAHNADGARALGNWIQHNTHGEVYLILGMTRNRDVANFCSFLEDYITAGVAVSVESEPSSYSASVLASKAQTSKINFTESDSLIEAIDSINKLNDGKPSTTIITGSLFLVSDFLKL